MRLCLGLDGTGVGRLCPHPSPLHRPFSAAQSIRRLCLGPGPLPPPDVPALALLLPFHLEMWTRIFLMTLSCPCFKSWRGSSGLPCRPHSIAAVLPCYPALHPPEIHLPASEPPRMLRLVRRATCLHSCFPLPLRDQGQGSFHTTLTWVPSSFGRHSNL